MHFDGITKLFWIVFNISIFSADNCYMKLKLESIRKASIPNRQMKQLDRVVQNYKPVSDHKHNVSFLHISLDIAIDLLLN